MKQGATLSSLVEPLLKGILDGYHSVDAEGKDHPIDQEYYKDWKLKKECIDHLVMMTNALANKEIISDPNNIIAGTKLYYDEKIVSGIVNDYFIQKEIEKEVKKVKEDVAK
jgi:hypothetical protein